MSRKRVSDADSFSQKMIDILNDGAINLAMGIGYRLGLFDAMDTFEEPQSAPRIAAQSGLNTRYVQEWLGVMVTGGIVTVSRGADGQNLYYLPKAHGDLLTRRAGNSNLGVYSQEIPLLTACAVDGVLSGFRTGEGVLYENYPRFQAFMAELANAKHRQVLVEAFLPSVDNGKLVAGLRKGLRVCDLGCAEGVALLLMAQAFPGSQFVGIDISAEAIEQAVAEKNRLNIHNAEFWLEDAAALQNHAALRGAFDYVTAFDAIHDQTRPREALKGVRHILASGGIFSMVDIAARSDLADNLGHLMGPFLYTVSLMHCLPVGLVDGGMGLGMMWGRERALAMLKDAGFEQVEVCDIPNDPFNLHFLCRV
jgi:2-polyprenyl-3-methyl-5-hydroxy-6-metoxy-1,4-benzoquinol methylase